LSKDFFIITKSWNWYKKCDSAPKEFSCFFLVLCVPRWMKR
jgi:hypothetical protein